MRPQLEIEGARRAHDVLLARTADLAEDDVGRPTLLPGWTIGHLLTHLARNADSHTAMFVAAHGGTIGDQYPGGMAQRSADIDAGADRSAEALLEDLQASIARLEAAWAATDAATWIRGIGRTGNAGERPLDDLVFRRWRETEVHHVDLGRGFTYTEWSPAYVDLELDRTLNALGTRLPDGMALRVEAEGHIGAWVIEPTIAARVTIRGTKHELLAWLLGRTQRPEWPVLAPW